jgi:hypothetical protein
MTRHLIPIILLLIASCKQREVAGIVIGSTLYESQNLKSKTKLQDLLKLDLNMVITTMTEEWMKLQLIKRILNLQKV